MKCTSDSLSFTYAETCFLGIDRLSEGSFLPMLSAPLCQSSSKRQPQDNSEQPPKWSKLFFPSDFLKIKLRLIAKQCIFILEEKNRKY